MEGNLPKPFYFEGSIADYIVSTFEKGDCFSVFNGMPSIENDITFNHDKLLNGYGDYVITETPASDPFTISLIVSLVISVAVVALTPKPELPQNVNRGQESPNNRLSSRTNRARPLERIPDIRGEVLSVPDVIQPTYSTFEFNKEIEHGLYCVGRKQYSIDELKDSDTPLGLITGASAGIYYPGNNPALGAPDESINNHSSEPVVAPYRSNQVDGITLGTEFSDAFISSNSVIPSNQVLGIPSTTKLYIIKIGVYDPVYEIGSDVVLTNCIKNGLDVSGTYEIKDKQTIDVFPGFEYLELDYLNYPYSDSVPFDAGGSITSANISEYTDWAYMTAELFNSATINVTAPQGMYKDTGLTDLVLFEVEYEIQLEGVDAGGVPDGNLVVLTDSIIGKDQIFKAKTTKYEFTTPTRFRSRAKRLTPRFTGSAAVVDTVQLTDVYAILDIDSPDFGDVTIIQTRTIANQFSTAIKERQLNCLATEMINEYQGSGVFAPTLTTNKRAVQSFITDAIDPVIGNRTIDEIDADSILALDAEINGYFNNAKLGEFSYTFDTTDLSFQDYAQIVFNAINCIAYRESGKVSALFERSQTTPSMLFTHRSKRPGSETYSRNFNPQTSNDGVQFTYVDPDSNTSEVIYIPEDKNYTNPKKFDIPGIRNRGQALIRARREYNKLLNKKINFEFDATAEGRYIRPNDLIQVVKGSRVLTFDGEVLDQSGLTLTLSADVSFVAGDHYIVLKNNDGSTESILATAGPETNQVILNGAPAQTIRTGIDTRRTEFSFGSESAQLAEYFLALNIDVSEKWFVKVNGINYSDSYYQDDTESVRAFSSAFSSAFG